MRRIVLLACAPLLLRAAPGLVATYSDGAVTIREVVPSPNFYLDPGETLHPALREEFGAAFRGRLAISQDGRYELFYGSAELEIDGRAVSGPRELISGEHELLLRYSSARGERGLRFEWRGPGFAREPVPARLFSHAESEAPREVERLAETGRRLAEHFGCANCHLAADTLAKRPGPPLDGIGSRTTGAWLKRWLENPQAFRDSAVMPRAAGRGEANDLAEYLLTLTADPSPDVPASPGDSQAGAAVFDRLGCGACHGKGGVSLEGLGSKSTIGQIQRYLLNPFIWEPSGRMPAVEMTGREALQIAARLVESKKPEFQRQPLGGDAVLGKQRFENAGCAACHQLEGVVNVLAAPAMEALDPERGCLSLEPAEPAPIFSLKPSEREALRAFVAFYKANPDRSRAPIYDFRTRLEQLRCNACHEIEGRPPTAALAEPAPSLTGAGDKLTTAWLRRVLSEAANPDAAVAPRMPRYHPQHVGVLAEGFAKAAGLEPGSGEPAREVSALQQVNGRKLLGAQGDQGGMGCIGCHAWGEHESLGEPGPDLSRAVERLRYDWFLRWMRDPARIHPGTSMPAYFASQTPLESMVKLETLWAGLGAPSSAGLPPGLRMRPAEPAPETVPQPDTEAVVLRADMPEASPNALAVGLPGGVSYCFDAAESRLLYAWRGGFIELDAGAPARLTGEVFYRQAEFPIRVDDPERIPEATFEGYRIVDGAPEMHYRVEGVDVFERILLRNSDLVRQIRLPRVDRPMWFVVAANEDARITTSLGSGLDQLELPRGENIRFEVRIAARR